MNLGDGMVQLLSFFGAAITALATYGVAKLTRSGSREANQTTGWTNLVAALQKDVESFRKEEEENKKFIKELDEGNKDLTRRVYVLERSRHRWKYWGRRVVEVMSDQGVIFPDPPEPLEDTDPNLQRS